MKQLCALAIGLLFTPSAMSAEPPAGPFFCIVDQVSGFAFDKQTKTWYSSTFHAGKRFIVKRTDKSLHQPTAPVSGMWAVWDFGEEGWPHYTCDNDFSQYGYLLCESALGEHFALNIANHRFIADYLIGYLQAGTPGYVGADGKSMPEGSDTPAISIGTCASL